MLEVAKKCKQLIFDNATHQEAFARSAYNRFYYSCFLLTREMCRALTDTAQINHSDVPDYLRATIKGRIKRQSDSLLRREHGNPRLMSSYARLKESGMTAADELAELLEAAYRVRVLADYEPDVEIVIQRHPQLIRLGETTLETAERWVARTDRLIGQIRSAWNQLN